MDAGPLVRGYVFLSAGIPDRPERGDYVETSDPIAIRDAIRALTSVVLERKHRLVFGGHPAVTPLIWQVAESAGNADSVIIYQSLEFENMIPAEAYGFRSFQWTPRGDNQDESLLLLRTQMIAAYPFSAAVFIGGMDGVESEYRIFGELHADAPRLPVASTGGAARNLWAEQSGQEHPRLRQRLRHDLSYRAVFEDVLANSADWPSEVPPSGTVPG